MIRDGLKLTIYFGERDRVAGRFLADHLVDLFERHRLRVGLVMRGVEGFGAKQQLRTDRLLTLSEDLPLVAVAVDEATRIEPLLEQVKLLSFDGLVTVERARMLAAGAARGEAVGDLAPSTRLTIYLARGLRVDGRPGYRAALEFLHRREIAGGTVLLGVDGTVHGVRHRARLFAANVQVPMMLISVGDSKRIERVLPELAALLDDPVITLERAQVLKRDGECLASPPRVPERDATGLNLWQKLTLFSSEQAQFAGHPVHVEAIRRLRAERASGATALRGVWGYHGRHLPHGDSFWSVRRRVPTVTVVIDRPESARRWWSLLDRVTPARGLITSEVVPAFQARMAERTEGGLRLAQRWQPSEGGG